MTSLNSKQDGTIILIFILTLPFLILTTIYFMNLALSNYQVAIKDQLRTSAQLAADAGADYSVEQFNTDNNWSGTNGDITLRSDSSSKVTYSSTISGTSNAKVISVTGKTYAPATSNTPKVTVRINVDMRPVTSGNFSIVSGAGGLYMSNSSKVVGGAVSVNGNISMQNTSQIGLSTSPITLNVAHNICPNPADATYPRVCNSGENGQPISISGKAVIYGTVTATNQTDGTGMFSPGLVAGSPAPQALPTYDKTSQKNSVTSTLIAADAVCSGNKGSITWPANLKITGNVNISSSCQVTMLGNVWITGTLTMTQSSALVVSDSLGSVMPVIMVDGSSGANFNNSSVIKANSSNTGAKIITFWSAAGCSPDCSTVTGTDLFNSRNIPTIILNNSGDAPNSILYAYWSQVSVGQSGQIGAIVGQSINLSNNGTITFGSSVGTSSTTWLVKGYRKQ